MIVFPNGKINLGLNIVEKRTDGYHNLETFFYPVGIRDVLEFTPSSFFECKVYGQPVAGDIENNLCTKAYRLLKNKFPQISAVKTGLYKNIPIGAGMGGGSSDGAFMIRLLNDFFRLHISEEQLLQFAVQLGSDCPFFILNTPCLASSRGDLLEPIKFSLFDLYIVLIFPGFPVSTAWAFSKIKPMPPAMPIRHVITQPVKNWRKLLFNDFEVPVFSEYPQLNEIKEKLYEMGAVYASLSGSGSALYGLFDRKNFQKEKITQRFTDYGQVMIVN